MKSVSKPTEQTDIRLQEPRAASLLCARSHCPFRSRALRRLLEAAASPSLPTRLGAESQLLT